MIEVKVRDNTFNEFDKAIKLFKKICNNDGFLKEIRQRRYFEKPSEKRRRKEAERLKELAKRRYK